MELAGEEMIRRDARRERLPVRRRRRDKRTGLRGDIIRMGEKKEDNGRNGAEKRRRFFHLELVPAHVRHLRPVLRAKADHTAGKNIEALLRAELLTLGEEQLKSEADAEKRRLSRDDVAHRSDEIVPLEIFHARARSELTRADI